MNKIIFFIKKPPVVFVVGEGRSFTAKIVSKILENKKILIFESDVPDFFLRKSKLPILAITDTKDSKEISQIEKLAKIIPVQGFLVLNFDNEIIREIKNTSIANFLTYGFYKKADLQVSDLNISSEGVNPVRNHSISNGVNFKINYQGNIVPFWLKNISGKEQVYNILPAIAVGLIMNMNLVEISQILRGYK